MDSYTIPLALASGAVGALVLLQWYTRGSKFTEKVRADGKVIAITGANDGIGKATAQLLAERGADVYLLCRSEERTNAAIGDLIKKGIEWKKLHFIECDLTSSESVRNAAETLKKQTPRLDILINNAARMGHPKHELTKDGFEVQWQTNHLSHVLLTELLLPLLSKSTDGRVVIVSSDGHLMGDNFDLKTVNDPKEFGLFRPYCVSKRANLMYAKALAAHLREEESSVLVNACHPGAVRTNIMRGPIARVVQKIFWPILYASTKSPIEGSQTSLHLALSEEIRNNLTSGEYFIDCAISDAIHPQAKDDDQCEQLYVYSIKAVGLD